MDYFKEDRERTGMNYSSCLGGSVAMQNGFYNREENVLINLVKLI